jgi:DNA invertase Pin-like site-specific DNA recombinase
VAIALNPPLVARDGMTLRVVTVCRISTGQQDERSLDDQLAKLKQFVADHFDGPVEWTAISSRGSGEHLDREEIYRLEGLIEGGRVDLVIAEDLARIFRRKRAYDLCESCVDFRTRLIAINDRVDTAEDGWEDGAFISTWHHERSNRDTSERVKRSLRNRFQQGGVCQTFSFGYIKPENTKSDADVRKVPEAEPVYDEWFTRLENGETFAEVADWLNQLGIPTGPWCAQKHWDGTLVGLVTRNPILKGERQRNRRIGLAAVLIRTGFIDRALCGGADAPITQAIFTGWTNMRVMARHDDPERASRPFDAQRNGLVLGEGAAMVVLESLSSAEGRGVHPLAILLGHGTSSDAHHITAPTVAGQVAAMRSCLADAELTSDRVDYLNLHGTATRANDECEAIAVVEVFGSRGKRMPASSTKSMLGHALGASGALEFVICAEALRDGFVPPTINCDEPDPDVGLDYVWFGGRI